MERQLSVKDRLGWTSRQKQNYQRPNQNAPKSTRNQTGAARRVNKKSNKTGSKRPSGNFQNHEQNRRNKAFRGKVVRRPNVTMTKSQAADETISMFVTIPLFVFNKRFTAAVDCFTGRTKIGKELAQMAISNGYVQQTKVMTLGGTEKRVQVITVHMGTQLMRLKPIDCIVDATTPPRGIIIGLRALALFGYRLIVDGVQANHHEARRQVFPRQQAREPEIENIPVEPFQEEEFIVALSESERKEIENME